MKSLFVSIALCLSIATPSHATVIKPKPDAAKIKTYKPQGKAKPMPNKAIKKTPVKTIKRKIKK